MSIRVRFAPSPSGDLHVGNARTALFNYLYAKKTGGQYIFRIEDTDLDRSDEASIQAIGESMRWLGLTPDEGEGVGGPHAPYRQSQWLAFFLEQAEPLLQSGRAYWCWDNAEEQEAERQHLLHNPQDRKRRHPHRGLSPVETQAFRNDGRKPALRFATDDLHGKISWEDGVRGTIEFDLDEVRDFNLIKSDGTPMYNWACVCDDHRMGITDVLRGEDGISNTPRQLLLYKELGWSAPRFSHLAFILGEDGLKLSKRHGDTGIRSFQEKGYLPEALINYLGLLGQSGDGEGAEVFSLDEMVQRFDPERLIKKASTFDYGKLDFLNAHWLRSLSGEQLAAKAEPFLRGLPVPSAAWLIQACEAFKGNAVRLDDLRAPIESLLKAPAAPAPTPVAAAAKAAFQPWPADEAGFKAGLKAAQTASGLKGKDFFMPLRLVLTGVEHGPELPKILALLGQDECFRRLDAATKGA